VNKEFEVHILNETGIQKARTLAAKFDNLLDELTGAKSAGGFSALASRFPSREMSLVRTHLELASFYAKKAMAQDEENQKKEPEAPYTFD
jgi:hypothetical protein